MNENPQTIDKNFEIVLVVRIQVTAKPALFGARSLTQRRNFVPTGSLLVLTSARLHSVNKSVSNGPPGAGLICM